MQWTLSKSTKNGKYIQRKPRWAQNSGITGAHWGCRPVSSMGGRGCSDAPAIMLGPDPVPCMCNGFLCPGGQAEVPSLQSVSSLPWEMVSSPFSSFADFICIYPDRFSFPSAWAGSQYGLGLELPHSWVSPFNIASGWACLDLLWQHNPECHSGN